MTTLRYARQTVLPEVGTAGQVKLGQAKVLCVGAGGLGSPALMYLAGAGVGTIGIVEFDRVQLSNLQRQILYSTHQVDQPKIQCAQSQLQAINPDLHIRTHGEPLNALNAPALFEYYDIIIDGTDNFASKYLINDAAVKFGKPWVYGAVHGMDGQVSVFDADNGPCYRCLYPEPPHTTIANCADNGVLGPVAGLVGVTQALQVIQMIVGHETFKPLVGQLWLTHTATMDTRQVRIERNPSCPTCSQAKETIELVSPVLECEYLPIITIGTARQLKDARWVDVRETSEWNRDHIEDAFHWPLSKLLNTSETPLAKSQTLIIYCQQGTRSQHAAAQLMKRGYRNVYSLDGGLNAWRQTEALTADTKESKKPDRTPNTNSPSTTH